jgi:hypothetical protein
MNLHTLKPTAFAHARHVPVHVLVFHVHVRVQVEAVIDGFHKELF